MALSGTAQGLIELLSWCGVAIGVLVTAYKTHKAEVHTKETRDEIKNNHGSSKGDAIDRTEAAASRIEETLAKLVDGQAHTDKAINAIHARISTVESDLSATAHWRQAKDIELARASVQREHQAELIKTVQTSIDSLNSNAQGAHEILNDRLEDASNLARQANARIDRVNARLDRLELGISSDN